MVVRFGIVRRLRVVVVYVREAAILELHCQFSNDFRHMSFHAVTVIDEAAAMLLRLVLRFILRQVLRITQRHEKNLGLISK